MIPPEPAMRAGMGTGVRWWNVYQDRDGWDRRHPAAAGLTGWVEEHLMRPHPELGRDGPVCPFVRGSTAHGLLWAGLAAGGDRLEVPEMVRIIDDALEIYGGLSDDHPDRTRHIAMATVFPELTRFDRIDAAHQACKSEVVRRGFMLGQFYPGCRVPGLWNREFHPLDAPVPMLVLRPMMSTDYPFLVGRTDWLYAYFTRMAPDLPRRLRHEIADHLRVEGAAVADITALRAHEPGEHGR